MSENEAKLALAAFLALAFFLGVVSAGRRIP